MKKARTAIIVALVLVVLLMGCAGASFSLTSYEGKTTIEVNNAEDGKTVQSGPFSVGKDKIVTVDATAMEKGALNIDFAQATVHSREGKPDEVIVGDVLTGVKVSSGDSAEFSMEKGTYVMLITAVGTTNGKAVVSVK